MASLYSAVKFATLGFGHDFGVGSRRGSSPRVGRPSATGGLATQAAKRFSRGYTVQVAYTFARSIDAGSEPFGGGSGELQGVMEVSNIRLDRGLSAFDATHRLAANFLWELPFFRGSQGLARSLFGGWQANGIVSLQSGFPFTAVTSEDYNLDGVFSDRPNAERAIGRKVGVGPHDYLRGVFGDRATVGGLFRPAASNTNGNLGRNTFRGTGYASVDFSVIKNFRMPWFNKDGANWGFRGEFFNLFNRVNLRSPGNSLGAFTAATGLWSNPNFGVSTSAFEGRQAQLALRFRF